MIGDSIAHGYPAVLWDNARVTNAGICGFEAWQAALRLKEFPGVRFDRVVVIVGINDLLRRIKGMIVREDESILDAITTLIRSADASAVYVVSLLPVRSHEKYVPSDRVDAINQSIRAFNGKLSQRANALKAIFVDAYSALAKAQAMHPEYTTDGIHLSLLGYRKLHQTILEAFALQSENRGLGRSLHDCV